MSIADEHRAVVESAISELESFFAEVNALRERVEGELMPAITSACGENPSNSPGADASLSAQMQASKLEAVSQSIGATIDSLMIYQGRIA